ncbi:MAG: pyridoxal phosphate-dependent aminotransferase [Methanocellales archaeon]|nr:pyridoxal phosphate-dependent aminotransferase [Methanocellales archaeon]MDD3291373.1 pyridoxal phosphate-dependent aminotransferase [Methanocellales archaeon]MDD5234737.1 pyridoxal phosphate-dependent aminotransferase [Methanocellales archaeon]MDD5484912.1 pyridoxal phosphate-dependent aminotransferase [Methanocellales archaeon]
MMSKRLDGIEESATFRVADLANRLNRAGKDVISFSLGEPDFDTPSHIRESAKKALDEGKTHYTPSAGILELRESIANKFKENGLEVTPNDIIVTPGAKQTIFEAILAVLNEGDEAILFEPAWVSYGPCIKLAGAKPVGVPVSGENFKPEGFEEFVTKKTKMIIVNSPCNPTGAVFDLSNLKMIADIAMDHDLLVLSDEIYEKILYNGEHISIGRLDGMQDRTITINGFSKTYAMTGWRLGYATAPKEVIGDMLKLQQHSASCATSFAQYGGIAALEGPQECITEMVNEFKARRDLVVEGLTDLGMKCKKPDGTFYVFANVGQFGSGEDVAERLLRDAYVAVTPGIAFGPSGEDYIRISYAISQARISEGLDRLQKVL